MDKHKILKAARAELSLHVWDYFCTESKSVAQGGNGVINPGCLNAIGGALLGVAVSRITGFVEDLLPGFDKEFNRAKASQTDL